MISRTRTGELRETYDAQSGMIRFLYGRPLGRRLLKLLICPRVSGAAGWLLSCRVSRVLVGPFVRRNHLDLSDYPRRRYRSFNDFFTREICPERRPVDRDGDHLIAPCDGKLTAIPITPAAVFSIKGVDYTLEGLLRDEALAERYRGGTLLLFRLSVDDYHRYCYIADGQKTENIRIPGVLHTVSPHAAERTAVYRENTREYCLLKTERFGTVVVMEVGAMLVGRICNHQGAARVSRGQEKGMFQFGGSSVVLLLEPGRIALDEDIRRNSEAGEETLVKMGERIGTKPIGPLV